MQASQVIMTVKETQVEEYRLVLRRGKISQIMAKSGAEQLESLETDPSWKLAEILMDGSKRQIHLRETSLITKGMRPPGGLFTPNERVAIIERTPTEASPATIVALLDTGKVTSITHNNQPVEHYSATGDQIIHILADDQPLVLTHLLGTDMQGRDLLSRILYGGRISLLVGIVATLVSLLIGVIYGAISGYAGGRTDQAMMAGVDILYAVPFMFLVIILMVCFGRSIVMLFVALGAVQWLTMARIVRGQVLSLKQREFIEAARMAGAGPVAILFRHLIPNGLGPVIVYTTLTVPMVILQESFLAFIGLQVQYKGMNLDSWGTLVNLGMSALGTEGQNSWLLLYPSIAMVATLLAMNCLGDGLRDVIDPRQKSR